MLAQTEHPKLGTCGGAAAATFPLVDREDEVAELRAALDAALAGEGRVVLLGGEPGIGKTRLASVIAEAAELRGVPMWWGRGWEDGSAPAFWPWNMALRRWVNRAGHTSVAAAADSWGAELAHVFPVLRDRIPELPPSENWQSQGARFRLFDLVSRFLGAVAQPSGLVIVLDDVHWADGPSLKLLEFVAADVADKRVLIVATYRDTEVESEHAFHATLSKLGREASTRRLLLGGLAASDCARWVTLSGMRGDAIALGAMLHRETNGNPFFVSEIVHLLAEAEDPLAAWTAQRVPQGAHEAIAQRLGRLDADRRMVLAVAALVGETIESGVLAEILADVPLTDHLERAVHDRILVENEERPGQYRFAHGLIRRVLADELQPSARAGWHARIAAVLERHAEASEVPTAEIVRHLAAAGTPEALHRAFAYACRGAEEAARGLGWEEAVRLYEIALDVGRRSGLLDGGRAIELRLALARVLRGAGDIAAARVRCEEVMAACRRTPDAEAFARAALVHAGAIPEWGRVDPAVRAALEEAYRTGPLLDGALRARLYGRLAADLIAADDVEQADRIFALCDAAAAAARQSGDPGALAVALIGSFTASVMGMRPATPGPVASSDEALAAAEAGREHEYAAAIRYMRAMTFFAAGEPEAFSNEADAVATSAAASHVPETMWLTDVLAAFRATVQGRFAEAREMMERAAGTGRRAQLPNALGVYASQRIMWHALQGRLAEIAAEIEAIVETHPMGAGLRPMRALARFASGDTVAARVEFQRLLAAGLEPAERGVLARTYLVGLAGLCVALRDREHAPRIYDCIVRRTEEWSIGGGQTLGPWALLLGALARLCERPADAARHFETAIRLGQRMASPAIVARAQSLLASLLLSMPDAAQDRERIAALLAEAARSAAEIGLIDVTARVARLRAKLGTGAGGNAFRCDGDTWAVRYAGRELRLKDGKGPRYLAALLAAPGRELHVLQFGAAASHGVPSFPEAPIADAPDEQERLQCGARLADLRAAIDEAEAFADTGRAECLRAELDQLTTQLAARFGARTRTRGSAETARKAVTKVLRLQIGKLLEAHADLGRHLRDTVRLGKVCVYAPTTPVDWDIRFTPPA